MLRKNFFSAEELTAIAKDFRSVGLPAEEVALMEFARNAAGAAPDHRRGRRPPSRTRAEEILDVVLTVTARSFMSKTLDALGAQPDEALMSLEPELRVALVVGRPLRVAASHAPE